MSAAAEVPEKRAEVQLPEHAGASAYVGVNLWAAGYRAEARAWSNDTGQQLVSASIGAFSLTVTPEQWVAFRDMVDAVLPVQVSA